MAKYGMAIDLGKCVGCGACALACKSENNTEYDLSTQGKFNWANFLTITEGTFAQNNVNFKAKPVLCNHCTDAPCIEICPVEPKAMFKTDDGITMHNQERCIGCKRCQSACPYSARGAVELDQVQYSVISYNDFGKDTHSFYKNETEIIPNCTSSPKEIATLAGKIPPAKNEYTHSDYSAVRRSDVVEKCIFCEHRVKNGENPYCVDSCPSGARVFGDLDDSQSEINQAISVGYTKLKNNNGDILAAGEAGTKPNVYYIGGFDIPVKVNEIEQANKPLLVYPNPTSGTTNVKFDLKSSSEISLVLFDLNGRKVRDIISKEYRISGEHRFDFNVSDLKTGTYILRLVTQKETQTAHLIVSR